jgi:hypothetical protein
MEARMNRAADSEKTPGRVIPPRRTLNFNDRSILALKPKTKLTDYWDPSLPGFGIRVTPSGRKTWIVMYRRPSGNASRMKLGTYPAVKLADARLAAQRSLGGIQIEHRDPVAEREADRKAETFDQLADEYMKRCEAGAIRRPSTQAVMARRRTSDQPVSSARVA